MKKFLGLFLAGLIFAVLAACGSEEEATPSEGTEEEVTEIVVGATSVPHAEVLEEAAPILEEEGIELTIETYTDYSLVNQDLIDGRLDANYFQHRPFLEDQIEEFDFAITSIGGVHFEAMGVYSKSIENVDDIPEGTEVIISRNVPDHGRILTLFEESGLITLDENVERTQATLDDIVENPLNLEFSPDVEPGFLVETYEREEDALVAINANFALEAGLAPAEDALFLEDETVPYVDQLVNLIVVNEEDADNPALNTLVDVLQSDEIQNFIIEEYKGAVVPVALEE